MLLTTCTNCSAQFRVIPEQLNIRQGRVMCGRCRNVFNAFESLKRVPDDAPLVPPAPPAPTIPAVSPTSPATPAVSAISSATVAPPTGRSEGAHTPAPEPRPLPTPAVPVEETPPAPAFVQVEPRVPMELLAGRPDSERFASPPKVAVAPITQAAIDPVAASAVSDDALEQLVRLEREFAERDRERERLRNRSVHAASEAESSPADPASFTSTALPDLDDEPQNAPTTIASTTTAATPNVAPSLASLRAPIRFVNDTRIEPTSAAANRASSVHEDEIRIEPENALLANNAQADSQAALLIDNALINPPRPSSAWIWMALLLLLVLAAQAIYFFRSEIVQRFPDARPALVAACDFLKCTVPWGRVDGAVRVDQYDLIEPPGRPGKMLLTATLVNRGATKQDFPNIELKLTDTSETVLSSRILTPPDYLGRTPSSQEGINPNAELYINLNLELAGKTPASGFSLRPFYP
jgi:predicted Zn finger-like uncharacterized protein